MSIVIGCSGSTGSSLLKTMLNRHSKIFAGPETNMFAFPQVYDDWVKTKHFLLTDIKTDAWQMRKGMDLLQPEFGWKRDELGKMIQQTSSFNSFVEQFFAKPMERDAKHVWIEKTPANAAGLATYLQYFPMGKIVQTVRNPYDTISSLMARGMNAYQATAYYVYNTAIATSNLENERYYHLKYEDLVANPTDALEQLFSFLKLPFEPEISIAKHEKRAEPTSMKGWKHQETAAVKKSSIGRFEELDIETKTLIQAAVASFKISPSYQQKKRIKYASAKELCAVLGYDYLGGDVPTYQFQLRKYYWKDRLARIKHGFGWQFFDYLGSIS